MTSPESQRAQHFAITLPIVELNFSFESEAKIQGQDSLDDFPQISEALINCIRKRLPGPWPDVNMTVRDIDKMAGCYAIVSLLESVFQHQAAKATTPDEDKDLPSNVFRFTAPPN